MKADKTVRTRSKPKLKSGPNLTLAEAGPGALDPEPSAKLARSEEIRRGGFALKEADIQRWVQGDGKLEVDDRFFDDWIAAKATSGIPYLEAGRFAERSQSFLRATSLYQSALDRDPELFDAAMGLSRVAARIAQTIELASLRLSRRPIQEMLLAPAKSIQFLKVAARELSAASLKDVISQVVDTHGSNQAVLRAALAVVKQTGALEWTRNLALRLWRLAKTDALAGECLSALSATRDFAAFETFLTSLTDDSRNSVPVVSAVFDAWERQGNVNMILSSMADRIANQLMTATDWGRYFRAFALEHSRDALHHEVQKHCKTVERLPAASHALALALLSVGEAEQARRIVEAIPDKLKRACLRATLCYEADELESGDQSLDEAFGLMNDLSPWSELIVVFQRRNQAVQRRRWTAADDDRPDDIQEVERRARQMMLRLWEFAVRQNPASAANTLSLAEAHTALGNQDAALHWITTARSSFGDSARLRLIELRALALTEPHEGLTARWQALLHIHSDPDTIAAASSYLTKSGSAGALILSKTLEEFPYHLQCRRVLAIAYAKSGSLREALIQWQFIVSRAAAVPNDHIMLARAYVALMRLDEAEVVTKDAARVWPSHPAWRIIGDQIREFRAALGFSETVARKLPASPRYPDKPGPILVEVINGNAPVFLLTTLIAARACQRSAGGPIVAIGLKPINPYVKAVCAGFGVSQIIEVETDIASADSFGHHLSQLRHLEHNKLRAAVEDIKIENLQVGDLLYDQILKFEGRSTIDGIDAAFIKHLREAYSLYGGYKAALESLSPRMVVVGHHPYLRHGLLLRLATSMNVPVALRDPPTKDATLVTFRTDAEVYHGPAPFNLKLAAEIAPLARKQAEARGAALLAKTFGDEALDTLDLQPVLRERMADEVKEFCRSLGLQGNRPLGVIFDHVPNDYVHSGRWKNFIDYVDWLEKTALMIKSIAETDWIIKLHPVAKFYGLDADLYERRVRDMVALSPNVRVVSGKVSAALMCACADGVVTARGTAAIEYPAIGTPTVITADAPFGEYPFVTSARDDRAYLAALKLVAHKKRLKDDHIRRAREFLGYFHEGAQVESELVPRLPGDRKDFRGFVWWETYDKAAYWNEAAKLFAGKHFNQDPFVKAVDVMLRKKERIIVNDKLLGLSENDARRIHLRNWFS